MYKKQEVNVPLDPIVVTHLLRFQQAPDVLVQGKNFQVNCHKSVLDVVPHLRKLIAEATKQGPPIVLDLPDKIEGTDFIAVINYLYYGRPEKYEDRDKFKETADLLGVDLNPKTFESSVNKYVDELIQKDKSENCHIVHHRTTTGGMITSTPLTSNAQNQTVLKSSPPIGPIGRPAIGPNDSFCLVKTPQRIVTFYEITPMIRVHRSSNRYNTSISQPSSTKRRSTLIVPPKRQNEQNSWLSRNDNASGIARKNTSTRFPPSPPLSDTPPLKSSIKVTPNPANPLKMKVSFKTMTPLGERKESNIKRRESDNDSQLPLKKRKFHSERDANVAPLSPLPNSREVCPVCHKDFKGKRGLQIHTRAMHHVGR